MFHYFRETFLKPRGKRWFTMGLLIESASARVADPALGRLRQAFPGVAFNLLSKTDRPEWGFCHRIIVKRRLGGLRLLLRARKHYDLVVFLASGERQLWLCRAFALLLMRPRRFFVFNEFGEGFWLHRSNWGLLLMHLERRYDLNAKGRRWRARWEALVSMPARRWARFVSGVRSVACAVRDAAAWLARQAPRLGHIGYSAALFVFAVLLLGILRLTYDARQYRFRLFRKTASAPQRKLLPADTPTAVLKAPEPLLSAAARRSAPDLRL